MLKVHEKQQRSNSFSSVWITDNIVTFQDRRWRRLEIAGVYHHKITCGSLRADSCLLGFGISV